ARLLARYGGLGRDIEDECQRRLRQGVLRRGPPRPAAALWLARRDARRPGSIPKHARATARPRGKLLLPLRAGRDVEQLHDVGREVAAAGERLADLTSDRRLVVRKRERLDPAAILPQVFREGSGLRLFAALIEAFESYQHEGMSYCSRLNWSSMV